MNTVKKIQGEQSAKLAELNVKLTDARHRFAIAEKNYKAIPPNVIKHRGALQEYILEIRKTSRAYEKAKLMFAERNPRYVEAKSAYETVKKEFEDFKKEDRQKFQDFKNDYVPLKVYETSQKYLNEGIKEIKEMIRLLTEKIDRVK